MKRIVIGTAGHIDHGKTALIKALTGIDCDRLKVEKERGITTELGFAHYQFDDDFLVGIVDVPGHEKFVRHMVAGAWGIDMVLLTVAADEGVMPQTREHIDICELLGLTKGIVAITKKDLVDEEMLELVMEDIQEFLKGRSLEDAPRIAVSSMTGENVAALKSIIREIAEGIQERQTAGIFRLPVDRVFIMKGLGVVITGTCISGSVKVGDEVEIYPSGRRARVRNIQTYHQNVQEATAGQRTALNLQGVERQEIERGSIIARPGTLIKTRRVDASLKYLKVPLKPVRTESILRFHVGATQREARLIILERDAIEPGEELFVQFVFTEPIVVLPGDRFVLRGPYAIQTIGGGTILDAMPGRHKRKSGELRSVYKLLHTGTDTERCEYQIRKGGYAGIKKELLPVMLGYDMDMCNGIVDVLVEQGRAMVMDRIVVHSDYCTEYKNTLVNILREFHEKNPLKIGISREELRTRLPKADPQMFLWVLDRLLSGGIIEIEKDKVRQRSVASPASERIGRMKEDLLKKLLSYGLTTPAPGEIAEGMGMSLSETRDLLERLVHEEKAVRVKTDIYFHREVIDDIKRKVMTFFSGKTEMTPADFKDICHVSRKYAIPLLEYFDEIKLTIRVGDKRMLRR